ncbi:endonuclease NucS domain-containing protein [Limosilactobacillus albertensis]|uniref:endonuclease NucS domain-containing protein n=1 Tax=Limosilactobacillus albertensis TaxID=2759752 RepID=UPI001E343EE6|nr:endonuclease NucS domain-containing protein [Limosilactobacillus albertensis]MCD7121527.1 endonuclease NucS [Limosilactobacillus albertensis]
MSKIKESDIRDYLVKNLDLIEPNLKLLKKEEYLRPDSLGTRGFIDILAVDSNKKYVVLELKKEKSASRQAIQELYKYFAALRRKLGLGQNEIRGMIVSTTWKELLEPFSEFQSDSGYDLQGIKLQYKNDDLSTMEAKKIKPLSRFAINRRFEDEITILEYSKSDSRDSDFRKLKDSADYVALKINNNEKKQGVIFPYFIVILQRNYSIVESLKLLISNNKEYEETLRDFLPDGKNLIEFKKDIISGKIESYLSIDDKENLRGALNSDIYISLIDPQGNQEDMEMPPLEQFIYLIANNEIILNKFKKFGIYRLDRNLDIGELTLKIICQLNNIIIHKVNGDSHNEINMVLDRLNDNFIDYSGWVKTVSEIRKRINQYQLANIDFKIYFFAINDGSFLKMIYRRL